MAAAPLPKSPGTCELAGDEWSDGHGCPDRILEMVLASKEVKRQKPPVFVSEPIRVRSTVSVPAVANDSLSVRSSTSDVLLLMFQRVAEVGRLRPLSSKRAHGVTQLLWGTGPEETATAGEMFQGEDKHVNVLPRWPIFDLTHFVESLDRPKPI